MNYQRAAELFATARDKNAGKPLENNTRLIKSGDDYAVVLHRTAVVTIHPDNTYTLNSGGWRTVTTKDRVNGYSPVRLFQEKGEWYIDTGKNFRKEDRVTYFDGIRIDANGKVVPVKAAA